jgi:hypothetical protein
MATKPLRFASFIRVSTEKQADRGESLRTQNKQNTAAVKLIGGVITHRYGGQEHATDDWEKRERDKMLADASKKRFDAVIFANVIGGRGACGRTRTGLTC